MLLTNVRVCTERVDSMAIFPFQTEAAKWNQCLTSKSCFSSLLPLAFISVISLSQSSSRFDIKQTYNGIP